MEGPTSQVATSRGSRASSIRYHRLHCHWFLFPKMFFIYLQGLYFAKDRGGDRKPGNKVCSAPLEEDWRPNCGRGQPLLSLLIHQCVHIIIHHGVSPLHVLGVYVVAWSNLSMWFHVLDPYEPPHMIMNIFCKTYDRYCGMRWQVLCILFHVEMFNRYNVLLSLPLCVDRLHYGLLMQVIWDLWGPLNFM
jgi:hypothetical protein